MGCFPNSNYEFNEPFDTFQSQTRGFTFGILAIVMNVPLGALRAL